MNNKNSLDTLLRLVRIATFFGGIILALVSDNLIQALLYLVGMYLLLRLEGSLIGKYGHGDESLRGDEILRLEKEGNNIDLNATMKEVRRNGATDEDIRTWWNMPDSQHKEIQEEDNIAILAAVKSKIAEGLTEDEAMALVKKNWPRFTEYLPGIIYGEDDFLPYELKHRINLRSTEMARDFKKQEADYSSMNAYIRNQIKEGKI